MQRSARRCGGVLLWALLVVACLSAALLALIAGSGPFAVFFLLLPGIASYLACARRTLRDRVSPSARLRLREPQLSADGLWWWDGSRWAAADQAHGVAEAFGDGPPVPPLEANETAKILLLDRWGPLRLLWAHAVGRSKVSGWSGEPRATTTASRRLVRAYFLLALALPLLCLLAVGIALLLRR